MKLEWGKKVNCPACALPFYTMQRTELECPNCGNKFNISELSTKKLASVPMDIEPETDEKIALSSFEFEDNSEEMDLTEESDLADKEVIEDIKLMDDEQNL